MEVWNTSYIVDATPRPAQDNGIIYDLDPSFLGHKKGVKLKHMLFFVHPALPLVDGRIIYWRIPHNEPTLGNDEATRRLWVKIQDASLLDYIKIASSKLNPGLAALSAVNTFKVNADIIRFGLDKKNGDVRETCGYGCQGGFFKLGQFAKELGLVEYDGAGNAVNIKPLKNNYFKKWGLPEADIVKLVTDLLRFNLYIKKEGWLGLFKSIIKHGVFTLKEGYSYVLEGLLDKNGDTVYSKILKRLVPKPWASLPVTPLSAACSAHCRSTLSC